MLRPSDRTQDPKSGSFAMALGSQFPPSGTGMPSPTNQASRSGAGALRLATITVMLVDTISWVRP